MAKTAALERFEDYVSRFEQTAPEIQTNIELKKAHTLRVVAEAQNIIADLGLEPDEARPVEMAALFHDIGRFPQFARYGTFQDRMSVNHGLLGYKELRKNQLLPKLSRADTKRILLTVLMHNRAQMVPGLPPGLDRMLRIVRDADKLDVIAVLLKHFDLEQPSNASLTLGLPDNPATISPAALAQVRSGQMVRYEQMRCLNDFKLLLLSWVYDLNFRHTRKEFLERGYVRQLIGTLPESFDIERLEQQLLKDLWF